MPSEGFYTAVNLYLIEDLWFEVFSNLHYLLRDLKTFIYKIGLIK